ncbi:MAG: hypothetical protein MRJ96_01685 [Nitrospirales bacterium]|nr:hypothetical protein [Nitrospira sp.]MDR4500155.1 hypothetical protein [Nitrospirales bacterium]
MYTRMYIKKGMAGLEEQPANSSSDYTEGSELSQQTHQELLREFAGRE